MNGRLEFEGTGGALASFDLEQGDNLRDHFVGGFNNIIDPSIVTVDYGAGVHLDRQTFVLPALFATETLTEIRFIGTSAGFPHGQAFLAALTVQTAASSVPEPASMFLLGSGFAGLALLRRRSAKKSIA